MPTPPSFVALPPMHTTTRAGPCSSACPISSPVPRVVVRRGSRRPSRTSASPDALAISTTATSPAAVGASPNGAVTDSPVGTGDLLLVQGPAEAVDERLERPLPAVGHRHELEVVPRPAPEPPGLHGARGLSRRQRAAELVGCNEDAHAANVQSAPTSTEILEGGT